MDSPWIKQHPSAPGGFFETEAAGLRWLGEAKCVPVAEVLDVSGRSLTLERLGSVAPTEQAAHDFGTRLAQLHDCGADAFGTVPPGAEGYFFGPLGSPLTLPTITADEFGPFYADARLRPLHEACQRSGAIGGEADTLLTRIIERLDEDDSALPSPPGKPARVHGDLWSGNLMWTPAGVTLIDPAACGHHRLADLAMLTMFGAPHLETIFAGYERAHPLAHGWREELPLHQLFGYLVHLHLFGPGYLSAVESAVFRSADLLAL